MLSLKNIIISYFKNYEMARFDFGDSKMVGICGPNGTGKTNLLDAIYCCCITKSYFSSTALSNLTAGINGFRIAAGFVKNNQTNELVCIQRETGKKEFQLNGMPNIKKTELLGQFPVVMIAPDDIEIINGGGEIRRKLVDALLSQTDPEYLKQLIIYNKVLQQRNGFLKNASSPQQQFNTSLLDILDQQLITPAQVIHQKRKDFFNIFNPLVANNYAHISGAGEKPTISYQSPLFAHDMATLLKNNLEKDRWQQRTTSGIHRDDIILEMDGQPFKNMASQGQKKSMLFALKLAEYESLQQALSVSPLLLLDDVFEKLDGNRMNNLLQTVCNKYDTQVVITDTHKERLQDMFERLQVEGKIIELGH